MIYPGHDQHGSTVSKVEEEKRHNPTVREPLATFVDTLEKANLDAPGGACEHSGVGRVRGGSISGV